MEGPRTRETDGERYGNDSSRRSAVARGALVFAAVGEAATGLGLVLVPSLVGRLLLGSELTGDAVVVARVAGLALIGLGIACWPGTPLIGMLVYGATVALYLGYLGLAGVATGMLLWPAVALHLILAALLTRGVGSRSSHRVAPPEG